MFSCPLCSRARVFATYSAMVQHSKAHHNNHKFSHPDLNVAYEDDWLAVRLILILTLQEVTHMKPHRL